MDKNEAKTPSETGAPDDLAAAASAASGEPKSEFASIESPALAPTEPSAAAEKTEGAKPKDAPTAAPQPQQIIPFIAAAKARAPRRFSKLMLFAASVVLAAAFGAMAGVLGATRVAQRANEAAPAADPIGALQSTITQLRSEVAALKAGVDASSRSTSAQYSKLAERFDKVEHAQSTAVKSDAALPKEATREAARDTTGSVTPPGPAAAALPSGPPSTLMPGSTVPGWAVRDVYRGVAMLQSRVGAMVEVEAGDVLPGLGRIEAIRRQDGRWVVVTSRGMIVSLR